MEFRYQADSRHAPLAVSIAQASSAAYEVHRHLRFKLAHLISPFGGPSFVPFIGPLSTPLGLP